MNLTSKHLRAVAVLALVGAAAGCSGSGSDQAASDIDPRSYYENYEDDVQDEAESSMGAVDMDAGAPAPETAEEGGVAPAEPPVVDEPGFLDDNTFEDPGDNTFVATAEDDLSTFGFDVDTGSYTIGRTFLDEGFLPDPDSVRAEEWINAFGYDYPEPDDPGSLAVDVAGAPSPFEDGTQLVRVGAQTGTVHADNRPDAAITLVVDTSGSMDIRERLGLVRSTLALFAAHLKPTDTVAVVTFENDAEVLLPPTEVSDTEAMLDAIEDLRPGGGTNLEAGLQRGYELAEDAYREDAVNTVILASDGVANVGTTGTDDLGEMITDHADDGIRLVTAGYGMGNYRDELMEQLANRGDGFYTYVDTYEEAERVFATELTTTLTPVANDARAQVAFDPEVVEEYRLVGYENRDLADDSFRDDDEDTGDLGAGHTVTAVYEVRLADDTADGADLGEVSVRHQPVDARGNAGDAVEQTVPILADDLSGSFDDAPPSLRLAATVAAAADLFGEHPLATDRDLTLDDVAAVADTLEPVTENGNAEVEDLQDLLDLAGTAEPSR